MRILPGWPEERRREPPGAGRPIPGPEGGDLALLAALAAVGLVPFAADALGAHWSAGRLLLGGALALLAGGQLAAALVRSRPGGRRHGLRVRRPRLVLLRGDVGPGAAVRPPVRGRR